MESEAHPPFYSYFSGVRLLPPLCHTAGGHLRSSLYSIFVLIDNLNDKVK